MFATPQINSCDLFVPNPAQHFLGAGNTIGGESCIGINANSGREISQRTGSEDLFSSSTQIRFSDVNDNHTSFHKYIAQKPLFGRSGRSGRFFTKPNISQHVSNGENDETESSCHVQVNSERNFVNLINGLSEKMTGLGNTMASISSEIKVIRGLVENHVKRSDDEISSGQRNAETVHDLLRKFETFFYSYKEHERMTSENSEIVKGDLKSIKDDALKASESIHENQEIMKLKLLETLESMRSMLRQETEKQVNHRCSQLFLEIEKKYIEKIQDLKTFLQVSLLSTKAEDHAKPEKKILSNEDSNSARDYSGREKYHPLSARATFDRPKNMGTMVRNTSSSNNYVALVSLHQNSQTCDTVTVHPANRPTAGETKLNGKKDDSSKAFRTQSPSGKENSKNFRRFRYAPSNKKQVRNCSSSFIQVNQVILPSAPKCLKPSSAEMCFSPSHKVCDASDRMKNCKVIRNKAGCSQKCDSEHISSAQSSQSSAVSISKLPFAKKSLQAFASASTMSAVTDGPVTRSQNYLPFHSSDDRIWM